MLRHMAGAAARRLGAAERACAASLQSQCSYSAGAGAGPTTATPPADTARGATADLADVFIPEPVDQVTMRKVNIVDPIFRCVLRCVRGSAAGLVAMSTPWPRRRRCRLCALRCSLQRPFPSQGRC